MGKERRFEMTEEEYWRSKRYSYGLHFVYTLMLVAAAAIAGVNYFAS